MTPRATDDHPCENLGPVTLRRRYRRDFKYNFFSRPESQSNLLSKANSTIPAYVPPS